MSVNSEIIIECSLCFFYFDFFVMEKPHVCFPFETKKIEIEKKYEKRAIRDANRYGHMTSGETLAPYPRVGKTFSEGQGDNPANRTDFVNIFGGYHSKTTAYSSWSY